MSQTAATFCLRCVITGRVQGVFYRAATQQQARALGVTGWVRNRADGTVELLACGEEVTVRAFETWLWQGSTASKVQDVKSAVVNAQPCDTFEIA